MTIRSILSIYLNSFIRSSFLCFSCWSRLSIVPLSLLISKAKAPFYSIWTSSSPILTVLKSSPKLSRMALPHLMLKLPFYHMVITCRLFLMVKMISQTLIMMMKLQRVRRLTGPKQRMMVQSWIRKSRRTPTVMVRRVPSKHKYSERHLKMVQPEFVP